MVTTPAPYTTIASRDVVVSASATSTTNAGTNAITA
ncbi:unannotated protein [freshwater metagenome]|uniref:Unannotated protein n=1 Tax=freshwater metagenome TaxID=449393 RepID=A0A6J6S4Z6_9ZZZZ